MRTLIVAAALLMTSGCMSLEPMREAAVGLPGYQAGATLPFGCPGYAVAREYTADGGAHGITCATRARAWAIPAGAEQASEAQEPDSIVHAFSAAVRKSFSEVRITQLINPWVKAASGWLATVYTAESPKPAVGAKQSLKLKHSSGPLISN